MLADEGADMTNNDKTAIGLVMFLAGWPMLELAIFLPMPWLVVSIAVAVMFAWFRMVFLYARS
jgi:hypothetical protein